MLRTPCQSDPERWTKSRDDRAARRMCETRCPVQIKCAHLALDRVEARKHPVGIWGGVFIPDDGRLSDDPGNGRATVQQQRNKALRRREAIKRLRRLVGRPRAENKMVAEV